MCYYILKANGKVLCRSTVQPLLKDEWLSEVEKQQRLDFEKSISKIYSDFDESLIHEAENDEMEEPLFSSDVDNAPDEPTDTVAGPDEFAGAEIYLPHYDRHEIAKVLGRKQNLDGNFVGRKHCIPLLDSHTFVVEFPDGDQQEVAYNVIAEHLFSQVDSDGNQYRLF